jgi:hypothetical protein
MDRRKRHSAAKLTKIGRKPFLTIGTLGPITRPPYRSFDEKGGVTG